MREDVLRAGIRRANTVILMNCPSCNAEGRIPNDKINTTLVCKKCLKSFHVKPSGRAVIGEARPDGPTAAQAEIDPGDIDRSAEVDQWFAKLAASARKFARYAAMVAAVLAGYGLYRAFLQPASLEEQSLRAASAIARNDLDAIRAMALDGTGDEAAAWFDSVAPEFKAHVRSAPSVVPRMEIVSVRRDPETSSAEVVARLSLAEPQGRMGIVAASTSIGSVAGLTAEAPFVMVDRGWGGWRLDGRRTREAARKEAEKAKEALSYGRQ
jgi:hypothetical protein